MIQLQIEGLEDVIRMCDPERLQRELDQAVNRSAEALRDQAKRMPPVSAKSTGYGPHGIPVDTGRMRQSVQKERLGLLAAGVYVPVDYADYVLEGTSKMPARPFMNWLLEDFQGLEIVQSIVDNALERAMGA